MVGWRRFRLPAGGVCKPLDGAERLEMLHVDIIIWYWREHLQPF